MNPLCSFLLYTEKARYLYGVQLRTCVLHLSAVSLSACGRSPALSLSFASFFDNPWNVPSPCSLFAHSFRLLSISISFSSLPYILSTTPSPLTSGRADWGKTAWKIWATTSFRCLHEKGMLKLALLLPWCPQVEYKVPIRRACAHEWAFYLNLPIPLPADCLKVGKGSFSYLRFCSGWAVCERSEWQCQLLSTFNAVDSCLQSPFDNDRRCAPSAHSHAHSTSFRSISVTALSHKADKKCRGRGWRMSQQPSSRDPCPPDIDNSLTVLCLRRHESFSFIVKHCHNVALFAK